ncbi:helix-turn-helix domain-containing protein [Mycolicibacterium fortuitum]|uniref:helix-turn-helix domain-containing protein n=1 Tax=Mycolicibacterium fortuitum TaxID=1766 RepID=UPI0039AF39EE
MARNARWLQEDAPELVTQNAVAEVTGLNQRTVASMIANGLMPSVRSVGGTYVPRQALLDMLQLARVDHEALTA